MPSPVLDLKYKVINETSVCLLWQAPLHQNGILTKYLISYTPDSDWPLEKWIDKVVPVTLKKYKVNFQIIFGGFSSVVMALLW